jgi:hypothetical protein
MTATHTLNLSSFASGTKVLMKSKCRHNSILPKWPGGFTKYATSASIAGKLLPFSNIRASSTLPDGSGKNVGATDYGQCRKYDGYGTHQWLER